MKKFLAYIFNIPLVMTEDYDGETRIRFVKKTPFGYKCNAISFVSHNAVTLNSNGTTSGKRYVSYWKPLNKKAESLFREANS